MHVDSFRQCPLTPPHLDPRLPEGLLRLGPLEVLADEEGGEGPGDGQPYQHAAAAEALESGAQHVVKLRSRSTLWIS